MPKPNDACLAAGVHLNRLPDGNLQASEPLVNLLVTARSEYDWPDRTGAAKNQRAIIELEEKVAGLLRSLNPGNAQLIVAGVSCWADNNERAQAAINHASSQIQTCMMAAINRILEPVTLKEGLDSLSELQGLRLVMATKVFRFCCPTRGAAVDRHASYFFNSLDILGPGVYCRKSTAFRREWSNGQHHESRLAIYYRSGHVANRNEFVDVYMPLMHQIATLLNERGVTYRCAATGAQRKWRPADVEMAAYYWWAHHGAK